MSTVSQTASCPVVDGGGGRPGRCGKQSWVLANVEAVAGRMAFPEPAIHDPESIAKVLGAMGLEPEAPVLAPARGPPSQEWGSG